MINERAGLLRRTRGAWTKDTKCTKGNFVARRAAGVLRKYLMINESNGAATKDTQSVDERHEVYEGQLCCTKSSGGATKNTRSDLHFLHRPSKSSYLNTKPMYKVPKSSILFLIFHV